MDQKQNLILLKGEDRTAQIQSCQFDSRTGKYAVSFGNGRIYRYNQSSVEWIRNPQSLNPKLYQIFRDGKQFTGIELLLEFYGSDTYWYILFRSGCGRTYRKRELQISRSCLTGEEARDKLSYLKELAAMGELQTDEGESLLSKAFERLSFVGEQTVLANYLNPGKYPIGKLETGPLIFPFGGNASQFSAVERAMSNQLSVIQGPPGTGKTQTILNIVANLLIRGKTVQVVSNNNSAIENVLEKLGKPQNGLDFLVAELGKADNKQLFIESQTGRYPNLSSWQQDAKTMADLQQKITERSQEMSGAFKKQERLACAKRELQAIQLEGQHFADYYKNQKLSRPQRLPRKGVKSTQIMQLLQSCEAFSEQGRELPFWFKVQASVLYGVLDWKFLKQDFNTIITYLQSLFYMAKERELTDETDLLEKALKQFNAKKKMSELTAWSMQYLKGVLYRKFGEKTVRETFGEDDLWKHPKKILKEYPIVLSTTFSSRNSLRGVVYDYVIMDEASQVDIATGSLALSCAYNAVIVGDLKQLPNVVTEEMKQKTDALFASYHLPEGYTFAGNSFLKSICTVFPDVPQTLLREHYRCHPQIIEFCNQKFYNNQLVVMTEDHGEKDALSVYRTVPGNHQRRHLNQREIDVTVQEALPALKGVPADEIGIITPYRAQVRAISAVLPDKRIEVDTVHKFQGREKNAIIISTVDDHITDFSGDPYLLNVAISRAKDKLCLVTSGNEQTKNGNIQDLIGYIQYHNFQVTDSKLYSVFDLLYQQYTDQRIAFLRKHQNISQYDSENIMFGYLQSLLWDLPDLPLRISCHHPLRQLIRDSALLTDEEFRYAFNVNTHLDFLIYNQITKQPVLAIEVDGVNFHRAGTRQHERDLLKNSILEKYGVRLLRLPTNGSGEMEKVRKILTETGTR